MSYNKDLFQKNPREYVQELLANGMDRQETINMLLGYMSSDTVRECLDANALSPRFLFEYEDEEEEDVPWACACDGTSVLDCTCTDEEA